MTKVIKTTPKKVYEKLSPKMNNGQKEDFKEVLKGSKEVLIYLERTKEKLKNKEFSPITRLENGVTLVCEFPAYKGQYVNFEGDTYYIAKDLSDLENKIKEFFDLRRKNKLPLNHIITTFVTDMSSLFHNNKTFNEDITNWDTSNVTNMFNMFFGAISFNQDISNWNVSNVTDMSGMFWGATSFNQPIGNWNTSNVINMSCMFYGTTSFNQPIRNWDTSNVTDMHSMFNGATSFNQPLNNWNVSNVTNMRELFYNAKRFNQDISNWNVSKVTNMTYMFKLASSFNQDISKWNISNIERYDNFDKKTSNLWTSDKKPHFNLK